MHAHCVTQSVAGMYDFLISSVSFTCLVILHHCRLQFALIVSSKIRVAGRLGSDSQWTSCADGQERVRASVLVHMDPRIKHVPSVLLNFVLKVMSPFIFGTIQKVLKSEFSSPDKVLPTRMREKPELYGLIGPRIAEYIHRLQEET